MTFKLGHKVAKVEKQKTASRLPIEPAAGGEADVLDADVVLVAIGRRPYTEGLGLEAVGVALRARPRRHRRSFRDQCARHLRHRRCRARADARA